ncbi:MAG: hypothetical protein Q8P73_00220 [bacterium]|nr:hypothetical protein [bacterium]MDZ4341961.1 hypothetical protein [Candidatus Binatia bacterium]
MRTIDLRGRSSKQDDHKWWVGYLADMASTPRNLVECCLEPPTTWPKNKTHCRVIDLWTPEELGVADGYPTDGMSLWWLIICLDGAPERMRDLLEVKRWPYLDARALLWPAEGRFAFIVSTEVRCLAVMPSVRVVGDWCDGEILGYTEEELASAEAVVVGVHRECVRINTEAGLPWTEQFHVRAGIGSSVRGAFSGLLNAHRDQLCVVRRNKQDEWISVRMLMI